MNGRCFGEGSKARYVMPDGVAVDVTVKFVGRINVGDEETYVGFELTSAYAAHFDVTEDDQHDGSWCGKSFFTCEPGRAHFCEQSRLKTPAPPSVLSKATEIAAAAGRAVCDDDIAAAYAEIAPPILAAELAVGMHVWHSGKGEVCTVRWIGDLGAEAARQGLSDTAVATTAEGRDGPDDERVDVFVEFYTNVGDDDADTGAFFFLFSSLALLPYFSISNSISLPLTHAHLPPPRLFLPPFLLPLLSLGNGQLNGVHLWEDPDPPRRDCCSAMKIAPYRVLQDFDVEEEEEEDAAGDPNAHVFAVEAGDIVAIPNFVVDEAGCVHATAADGARGLIPATYVEPIQDLCYLTPEQEKDRLVMEAQRTMRGDTMVIRTGGVEEEEEEEEEDEVEEIAISASTPAASIVVDAKEVERRKLHYKVTQWRQDSTTKQIAGLANRASPHLFTTPLPPFCIPTPLHHGSRPTHRPHDHTPTYSYFQRNGLG